MKRLIPIALAALAMVFTACQAGSPGSDSPAGDPMAAGNAVMDFELASLNGGTLGPGHAGEELTLVDFWATWCGPCHLQADILAKLYPEFKRKGVEFLAVSVGEPEKVVREFVARRPFQYPVLVDPADTIANSYGVFVLPTVVLLDRDGSVVYLHEGISTASRLRNAVDQFLEARRGRAPGPDSAAPSPAA